MDHTAISKFISENMKTIFAYSLNRISNQEEAEELCSEIILSLLNSGHRLKNENAIFGFIWATANNTYKKYLSQKQKRNHQELDETIADGQEDMDALLVKEFEIQVLRRELALLSKEYRICTIAYYFQDISCKEIADIYGFSLEMVKYYLFKSRKILKEGMDMERKFGEKSFNPATFEFRVIFEKQANMDYVKLFRRKLCGNILLSAYYSPVSVQELSLELGIGAAYLEDELDLLERHGLVLKDGKGKYRTNIIIFTENYADEVIVKTTPILRNDAHSIYESIKKKLNQMRQVEFYGKDFTDNQIVWLGVILALFCHPNKSNVLPYRELIPGCTGAAFGYDYQGDLHSHYFENCAGFSQINDEIYATFVNLHVLRDGKYDFNVSDKTELIQNIKAFQVDFPILTNSAKLELLEILSDEVNMVWSLYDKMIEIATSILIEHAPEKLAEHAGRFVHLELNFAFLGMLPEMMVRENLLEVPEDQHVGMYVNIDPKGVEDFYEKLRGGGCKLV
jgi:RNA polymerase sigma factor (sigma-70 family)